MTIILIAEFIAELNTDRARASIRALIGSVPTTALVRADAKERRVGIATLNVGDVVLVKAGDKIPVDGTVVAGDGSVDESPISGESMPIENDTLLKIRPEYRIHETLSEECPLSLNGDERLI